MQILKKPEIKKLFQAKASLLEIATSKNLKEDFEECVFCHNCFKGISKDGKCPRMSVSNGLQLDEIPPELQLSDTQQQLIALDLLFMKIQKLPTSRMRKIAGKMINVPLEGADILKTLDKLPRRFEDSFLVPVNLKMKSSMVSSYISVMINPKALIAAVSKLKQLGNIHYQFIPLDTDYESRFHQMEANVTRDTDNESEDSDQDDENNSNILSNIHEFQSNQNSNVCLIPHEADTLIVENLTNNKISKKKNMDQKIGIDIYPGKQH